jgi:hypothetical protein
MHAVITLPGAGPGCQVDACEHPARVIVSRLACSTQLEVTECPILVQQSNRNQR